MAELTSTEDSLCQCWVHVISLALHTKLCKTGTSILISVWSWGKLGIFTLVMSLAQGSPLVRAGFQLRVCLAPSSMGPSMAHAGQQAGASHSRKRLGPVEEGQGAAWIQAWRHTIGWKVWEIKSWVKLLETCALKVRFSWLQITET